MTKARVSRKARFSSDVLPLDRLVSDCVLLEGTFGWLLDFPNHDYSLASLRGMKGRARWFPRGDLIKHKWVLPDLVGVDL